MSRGDEILLRARQAFSELRQPETLRKIEVPEWGAVVYYWPSRSMEERRGCEQYIRLGDRSSYADLTAYHAAQVCFRARDEFGQRLFRDDQEAAIAQTHPEVIARISSEMGLGDGMTLEEAEKK
jgi:hypothetical protein